MSEQKEIGVFKMIPGEKEVIMRWGSVMAIFLIVAVVCISFIFAPVTHHMKTMEVETITQFSGTSLEGLLDRAELWKTYPNYIAGLGIAAGLSFAGAVWVAALMYGMVNKEET